MKLSDIRVNAVKCRGDRRSHRDTYTNDSSSQKDSIDDEGDGKDDIDEGMKKNSSLSFQFLM